MKKKDYVYFLYKTNVEKPKDIENLFNKGIRFIDIYNISGTFNEVEDKDLEQVGIQDILLSSIEYDSYYNSVVLVKIPESYLGRHLPIDPIYPLYRLNSDFDEYPATFTPKLIQGVYCRDIGIGTSFTNPNFNPIYNPNGAQYFGDQLNNLKFYGNPNQEKVLRDRQNYSFNTLEELDRKTGAYNDIYSYYCNKFGMSATNMVDYKVPDEYKSLFEGGKTK